MRVYVCVCVDTHWQHGLYTLSDRYRDSILQIKKEFNKIVQEVWADKITETEKIKRKNEDIRKVVAELKLGGTDVSTAFTAVASEAVHVYRGHHVPCSCSCCPFASFDAHHYDTDWTCPSTHVDVGRH